MALPTKRIAFEHLKAREMLATVTWTVLGDMSTWVDASNCNLGVPVRNDNDLIPAVFAGSSTNIGAGQYEVNQIDSQAPIILRSATLTTTHIAAPNENLTQDGMLTTFAAPIRHELVDRFCAAQTSTRPPAPSFCWNNALIRGGSTSLDVRIGTRNFFV